MLALVGAVLVVAAWVDALWTTLWTDGGGGPLTTAVSRRSWALLTRLPPRVRGRLLGVAGPALLLLAVALWVLLLVVGWWLVFLAGEGAVVDGTTRVPADAATRLYYVGFSLFTLGVGDVVPQGAGWQAATVVMTASGLFIVTLSITYLVQVVSAVVDKRAFAGLVHSLGRSPTDIVTTAWDGQGFAELPQQMSALTSALVRLSEQHLAYPVLHYVHSGDPRKSSSLAVAVLDDALMLLAVGVVESVRPPPSVLVPAARAVGDLLETLAAALPDDDPTAPPPPDIGALGAAGPPVVAAAQFAAEVERRAPRRRRLQRLVIEDAWAWDDVAGGNGTSPLT